MSGLQKHSGRNTLKILAAPNGRNARRIAEAVRVVNFLQNYFRCDLIRSTSLLCGNARKVTGQKLAIKISKAFAPEPVLALTEEYFDTNIIVEEHLSSGVILASCVDWEVPEQPPTRLFILYQIAAALITFEAGLDEAANEAAIHKKPVGCLFDWWLGEEQLGRSLLAARLCPKCLRRLKVDEGVSTRALDAVQRILEYIRRVNLEDDDSVPSKIFIAHGRDPIWIELRKMIGDFGLEVAEFNEEEQSGRVTTARWIEMLGEACFAFAFLTPQEQDKQGRWLPSLNVIHEVGLCHARLGFDRTILLRGQEVRDFSNITGVSYLDYDPHNFGAMRERIRQLLIERGIL